MSVDAEEKIRRIRKRLRDDFEFYAKNALLIRTKDGEFKSLEFNQAQKHLARIVDDQHKAEGKVRVIVLKGRQMGISTWIGGRLYFRTSQRRGARTLVMTHEANTTETLFTMTQRFHANVPDALKPKTKYSSKREIVFDILDSSYTVATAGSQTVARGDTIQFAHLSEVAFWPKSSARDIWAGLEQAIPNAKDTEVYIESTANGVSGVFYDLWQGAVKGENGFIPVFLPWYWMPEYREEVPAGFTRTPEEEDLVKKFGLDDGQLMFRRRKIARNGLDMFKQEYPMTPDEAFLTSGRPVFNPEQIAGLLDKVKEPIARLALEGDKWVSHPGGELICFHKHDPAETYYIGADIAMGVREGDYSVAQVLDSRKRQVAVWRGHVHPDYFATVLYHLGHFYNEAKIIPESNNHGILTCTRLAKDLGYQNVYTEEQYDKITDRYSEKIGFSTTSKTKPLIIDKLRAAMREGEIEVNDPVTLREMMTYIVTESGNMEAEGGCYDDCVMALALANHINEGYFEPIVNADEWLFEMI